ncbi:MAG: winged helix-turn-helix transcriptional regulator [Coriobacteriia bacterium]|nr:winged helix-turn-helix transcriptional regulator [Coriobacteriia bacterium]
MQTEPSAAPLGLQVDAAFRALASAQRREILRILGESTPDAGKTCCGAEELCGCKLAERMGLAASTISHHMSALTEAGLVGMRRDGKWAYYTLRRDALEAVKTEISAL